MLKIKGKRKEGGPAMPIELWTARMERPLTGPEREAILPLLPPARRERLLRTLDVGKQP